MKSRKLAVVLLSIGFLCVIVCTTTYAKKEYKALGPDELIAVQNVELSKADIYDQIMIYIANNYNSPKDVIKYSNKEQGAITLNIVFEYKCKGWLFVSDFSDFCKYNLAINIKDNKYKIEMTPLNVVVDVVNGKEIYSNSPKDPCFADAWRNEFNTVNNDLFDFLKKGGSVDF